MRLWRPLVGGLGAVILAASISGCESVMAGALGAAANDSSLPVGSRQSAGILGYALRNEIVHQQRVEEAQAGASNVNVNVGGQPIPLQNVRVTPPEHVIYDGKNYHPEQGYTWVTGVEGDFRVRSMSAEERSMSKFSPTAQQYIRRVAAEGIVTAVTKDINGNGSLDVELGEVIVTNLFYKNESPKLSVFVPEGKSLKFCIRDLALNQLVVDDDYPEGNDTVVSGGAVNSKFREIPYSGIVNAYVDHPELLKGVRAYRIESYIKGLPNDSLYRVRDIVINFDAVRP